MMLMTTRRASRYTPPRYNSPIPQTETISISLGLGNNDHSSSIVLPRGHALVKHLEQLIPATAVPQYQTQQMQPPFFPRQSETEDATAAAARFDAVRALSSLPYQQSPQLETQSSTSALFKCIKANSLNETSPVQESRTSMSLPSSPLYPSDESNNSNAHAFQYTQECWRPTSEPNISRTRCRRSASNGNSKRCQVVNCDKISVSRGLCRGHGGGRRCQHMGCCKGAQSRSDFCWAHGGGQRCQVKGCMRSRKSKLYCVAHLNWENSASTLPAPTHSQYETPHYHMELPMPRIASSATSTVQTSPPRLPSLLQALRTHTRSNLQ
ncbi:unnamed protein product [Peronospora belbahrii]|uniref:WRKY19-like zinc finger domain-containing protein n=1 Tax=Peronospora belbahrii TaxID=622444 RepID=A0AAU9LAE0_9STRA|nr:unnamed protein product [Peronospora belbahrii]CAH0521083.1 unnamed protein product [Peronospora belbahrii]